MIRNDGMTGKVHQDGKLLTGNSQLVSDNVGLLAADALVEAVQSAVGQGPKSQQEPLPQRKLHGESVFGRGVGEALTRASAHLAVAGFLPKGAYAPAL